jgi:hypothetical protein
MTERFEADADGITWRNRGRVRSAFGWGDLKHLRLEGSSLSLEGPPDTPVLRISTNYKGFDELRKLIQRSVEWESLARARPRAAGDIEQPDEILELPIVRHRWLPFGLFLFAAFALAGLSALGWRLPTRPVPAPAAGVRPEPGPRDKIGEFALAAGVWVVLPALALASGAIAVCCWNRFRVDEEGMQLRSFVRTRRYPWGELRSVRVRLRVMEVTTGHGGKNTSYAHVLIITPRDGKPINLDFAERCFAYRDMMVAAAARAGVSLRHD